MATYFTKDHIQASVAVKERMLEDTQLLSSVDRVVDTLRTVYDNGGKILIAGNGGSAADAQHFAAEITCQYKASRKGYPAIALHTDGSALTAWGNDKTFESFFSRQVEALGVRGDALVVISTSGNSKNILRAVEKAKEMHMYVFALLGKGGGALKEQGLCDEMLIIPSDDTPRIQESHITLIHSICEALDEYFLTKESLRNEV